MSRFLQKFNDMKLRNKMVVSYVLFFILPFMVIGFFVVQQYRQSALDKAIEQMESTMERVMMRTNEILNVAISLSNRLTLDTDLANVATARYSETSAVVDAYRNYKTFRSYLDFNPQISRIKLYADNPTLLNNWELIPLDADTKNSFWYRATLAKVGQIGWYYFPSESRNSNSMLSLVRSVYFQEKRVFGMLEIDLNTGLLNASLEQEDAQTILADEKGFIVASNRPDLIGKVLRDTRFGNELAALAPGTYGRTIEGRKSKALIGEFTPDRSYTPLRIISVFPVESIVKEANRISSTGFKIIGMVTLISLILIYFICTVLTKRLLLFNRQIQKVSMGNFVAAVTVGGNDEIGQISRQFNQMVVNIRELMEELNRSHEITSGLERKQNEIKLKMLASQINPHFLYNALESIRMKAHLHGQKEIAQTVKLLGRLMRKKLEIKGKEIDLAEEIEIIRCYLEIQKFRHDDRLNYEIDIDPAVERLKIMPLLIQPLVENAVIHGLEKQSAGGKIKVGVLLVGTDLEVVVADNGVGFAGTKLEEVRESLRQQDADRIGLHNIQQRLLLTYGEASRLRIDSENGKGTRVSFRIPVEGSAYVQSADCR
jgi:two-component system sensor histidine kinase YesM